MSALRKITGPFILDSIDDDNVTYLKLKFSDGQIRQLSKGGNWPKHISENLFKKAEQLKGKSVYIVTSQTTKNWEPSEWLCDIYESNK
jgi:hypothetical protein